MARMHSRKKGKSGSIRPLKKDKKIFASYSKAEIEQLIVKLAKSGNTASSIGLILRDTYGIPDVFHAVGKSIVRILAEHKLAGNMPEDLRALIKKDIVLMKHAKNYKKDIFVKRGLLLTFSKINRLSGYYKREGKLSQDWKYDREKAKTFLE